MTSPATVAPAIRPLTPRASAVVAKARELLEREGPDALTMRRLAADLDIRAPSIYKHLAGKHAIEVALIDQGLAEAGEAMHAAIRRSDGVNPVADLLRAYRQRGTQQPNLYRLFTAGRLPRDELTPGLDEWAGEPFLLVTGDEHLAQALWSFAHGMVVLEIDGRYPEGSDLDRTWAAGAAAFRAACPARADRPDRARGRAT